MVAREAVKATVDACIAATNALDHRRLRVLIRRRRGSPQSEWAAPTAVRESSSQCDSRLACGLAARARLDRLFVARASGAYLDIVDMTPKSSRTSTIHGVEILEVNDAGEIEMARFYFDPAEVRAIWVEAVGEV